MRQTIPSHRQRRGLGGAARDIADLAFEAFEALAERQYAAPWAAPARPTVHAC